MPRHRCPRPGCTSQVDNRLFACHGDWFALSQTARIGISNTASLNLLSDARRAAIQDAMDEWRALAAVCGRA